MASVPGWRVPPHWIQSVGKPLPRAAVGPSEGTQEPWSCEAWGRKWPRHRSAAREGGGKRSWSRAGRLPVSTAPLTGAQGQPFLLVCVGGSITEGSGRSWVQQTPRFFTAAWSSGSQSGPGAQQGGQEQVPPTWPGRAHCITTHGSQGMPPPGATERGWVSGLAVRAALSVLLRALPGLAAAASPGRPPAPLHAPPSPAKGKGLLSWGPEAGGAVTVTVTAKLAELREDPQPADSFLPALPSAVGTCQQARA